MSKLALGSTILILTLSVAGCAGDGGQPAAPSPTPAPPSTGTPTFTASPTVTASSTATPTPTWTPTPAGPTALAKRITAPSELIGGALATGRLGDYLLANDRIRTIIRDVGREPSFAYTYGGNIIDADIVRPAGEPGRDNFGAMTPLINLSLTVNVQEIVVVNDGRNGEPAVLRTFGVDDLFDAIDPTNAILQLGAGGVPEAAQDRDIPVEIVTEYTLAPGEASIRIETTVFNNSDADLALYAGDYVTPSGELDSFVPGLGFGDALLRPRLPYLAYAGTGSAVGVSYGILPLQTASAFSQSGFTAYVLGQSVLQILLTQQPGALRVPARGSASFARHFAVGDGDIGAIAAENYRLAGIATGRIRGQVLAGGLPAAGARVSLVQRPGRDGAAFNVVAAFRTGPDGRYEGRVEPGNYLAVAKLDGYPYDSGGPAPLEHAVTVSAGDVAVQNFSLPATGRLRVRAADAAGRPLPAKVSVVGFDRSPDPGNTARIFALEVDAFVFGAPTKQGGIVPFGLAAVHFIDVSGDSGELALPPGEYEIVVSRGPEYSAHSERVVIGSDVTTTVDARLVRVIDTSGFVAADHHVHLLASFDCGVTRDERILTMLAEGIELFAATDHDFITDLRADIVRLGAAAWVTSVPGVETTTFNLGHFNFWPLEPDPGSRIGGPPDWGRSGVPAGMDYPALGSYDLSPAELFALAPPNSVVQINHFNSTSLGFFHLAGIDTALVPPQSFSPPRRMRQNPAIDNLYSDGFTALELWIEGSRSQAELMQRANLGDWFNLLNQGRIKTGTANSDTHSTALVQAGGPRSYVASLTDDPAALIPADLVESVNDGRVIGSNGPFIRMTIEGDGSALAGLDLGLPRMVTATSQAVVHLQVQSPDWARFDTIELYANTIPVPEPDLNLFGVAVPRYTVEPTLTLVAGVDFEIEQALFFDGDRIIASRDEANVDIVLPVERDTWVVVLVKGTDGISPPLWPANPKDLDGETNRTLDDLTDGNLGEGGVLALAFTNPLFVDADGDGALEFGRPR